jgi:hypothetical protein
MKEFTSTKDFSVGDMFLNHKGEALCYITKIVQVAKGYQYEYQLCYFNEGRQFYQPHFINTLRLKDKMKYGVWKHIPVVK